MDHRKERSSPIRAKGPAKKEWTGKRFLAGCGLMSMMALAIAFWVGIWLFREPRGLEKTEYHPFRSAEAKELFLNAYAQRARRWPVISECRTLETSYGHTFVRMSGPKNAPPLVLLHGLGGNSLQWAPNIRALSESYRTYAVDNVYDYGRSVYTRPMRKPDDFVNWLEEVFNALQLGDRINLMGLSYGGWLTSQFALHSPTRLDKIVLLAPASTVLPLRLMWMARAVLCALPYRVLTRSFLYWLLEDLARNDESGRVELEGWVNDSFLAVRCFKPKPLVNPTVLSDKELQSLKMPVLYMVGENEKIYSSLEAIDRLHKVAPQIRTELIPHAGHDLTLVQAELVNQKVLEFLGQP